MEITKSTKLSDLVKRYPCLKKALPRINDKFKMLGTPMGKVMMGKATIADMSEKSGMDADELIDKIRALIDTEA